MQFWKIRYPQRFYLYLWHLIGIPHFSFNYFEKILTQEVMFHFGSITFNDTHPGKHLINGCLYYKTIFGYKVTFDVSFYIYICILYVYIYMHAHVHATPMILGTDGFVPNCMNVHMYRTWANRNRNET